MTERDDDSTVCLACDDTIHPGDRYFPDASGEVMCAGCSPTYQELIDAPEGFVDGDEEPRTPDECGYTELHERLSWTPVRRWLRLRAAGGEPSDTMATRIWT